MGNNTQVKQEGDGSVIHIWGGYHYINAIKVNKSNYKSNITEVEDVVFTQGHPYDAVKHEEVVGVFTN